MNSRVIVHLALAGVILAAAGPALAETAYVPVSNRTIDGVTYTTHLWISNPNTLPGEFSTRFIPFNTDGTPPAAASEQTIGLPAGGTFFLGPLAPENTFGVLEITGDPSLVVVARLVGTTDNGPQNLGANIPAVGSRKLFAANEKAVLQGIERSADDRRSSFGILNLGDQPAQCLASVIRADGVQVGSTAVLPVKPFGMLEFYDALSLIGLVEAQHLRIDTTCDQPFFPYSVISSLSTGETDFVSPSSALDLGLGTPGPVEPPPPGVVRLSALGTFHNPSPGNAVKRLIFDPPSGLYRSLRAQLDVRLGPWAPSNPSGTHNIFWMVRDGKNKDMFGYVNVKGPNSNSIFVRHGLNQTQDQKARMDGSIVLQPGSTYHFDYIFNTESRFIELIVSSSTGAELIRLRGTPNTNHVRFDPGQTLVLDFGFQPGVNPAEPPTYGWEYRDLIIDLDPE